MSSFRVYVDVAAPPDHVWGILADYGGVHRYSPSVTASHVTGDQPTGVGATRHCDLALGASVEERVLDWADGSHYEVEIYDGKRLPPIRDARAKLAVTPRAGGGSIMTAEMTYRTRFGPIGAFLDRAVIRKQFRKSLELLVAGVKHVAETGEEIDGDVRVDTSAVQAAA